MPTQAQTRDYHHHDWHRQIKRDPDKHYLSKYARIREGSERLGEPISEIVSVRYGRPTMPLPNGITGYTPEIRKKGGKAKKN